MRRELWFEGQEKNRGSPGRQPSLSMAGMRTSLYTHSPQHTAVGTRASPWPEETEKPGQAEACRPHGSLAPESL